jgi:transposase
MIDVTFTQRDLNVIDYERFNHPMPYVQRRKEILWLKSKGISHKQIAELARVCPNTVTKYIEMYLHGGLDEIKKENFYRPQTELINHCESLEQYFRENPVSSVNEAITKIQELTGIQRKKSQVRVFLRKIGMRPRKMGAIPGNADPAKQEEFKKKFLNPN